MSNLDTLVEKYRELRLAGQSKEEATREAEKFVKLSQIVTKKDLSLALAEFAKEHNLIK